MKYLLNILKKYEHLLESNNNLLNFSYPGK